MPSAARVTVDTKRQGGQILGFEGAKRGFRFPIRQTDAEGKPYAEHYLAEINAVHPFREGNGRTQPAFLILLAESAGFAVDADGLDRDRVLHVMIDSFLRA